MKVAIAGATGLIGHFYLSHLLQNPKITELVAIGRSATGLSRSGWL